MKRISAILLIGVTVLAVHASASDGIPLSPSDMTSALERKIVSGVGVMYPGSDLESATTPALALLDAEWPDPFLDRIGETISVRVSSTTGYYEFTDESGSVFWIEIPVAPLTWNWVAPFLRPYDPPTQDFSLIAPWHLADRWRLSTEALEELRAVPPLLRSLPLRSAPGTNDVTNLCFTAFTFTETNLYFTAAWPTNDALPDNLLDLYCSTNELDRFRFLLSSHPATNPPVSFDIPSALVPNWGCATSHVHNASCPVVTNIVLSPLDGTTIYTNVVYGCAVTNSPQEAAFFRLGSRVDTDGDGLADAYELYVTGTCTNAVDTDLDGLSDFVETTYGTNPNDSDTDGDGLFDFEEVHSLGIDPCNPDTDGDGLSDAEETGYCHRTETFDWFDPLAGTNLLTGLAAVLDDATWEFPLEFPLVFGGVTNNRVVIDINGLVHLLSTGESSAIDSLWANQSLATWTNAPAHITVASAGADYVADSMSMIHFRQLPDEGVVSVSFWALLPLAMYQAGYGYDFHSSPPSLRVGGNAWYMCTQLNIRNDPPDTVDMRLAIIPDHPLAPASIVGIHDQWRGQWQNPSFRYVVPRSDEASPTDVDGPFYRLRLGTGTNPLRADSDGDGLTDFAELRTTHTDPLLPDTDGDGETDGFEAGLGTNPLSPDDWTSDADGDGLTALDEALAGTNPSLADTDGDGVADGVELTQGSNPLDSSDGGAAPDPATLLAMPFRLFGDYAAWAMTVEGIAGDSRILRLATPAPNVATATNLLLRRGAIYRIHLDWLGSPGHNNPDWYCWEARLGNPLRPSGRTFADYNPVRLSGFEILSGDGWYCENGDGLLTTHVHSNEEDGGNVAAGKTAVLHVLPAAPEFVRDVVGVQCNSGRRVEVALTPESFRPDVEWALSPVVADGPRLFETSNSVSGATSMTGCSNVWVSAGTVPGVYSVTVSYPGFTNATAYVVDPVVDINGDFFRSGTPADDPREADLVCFTNNFGFVIPCNNNDSDGDGVSDCLDNSANGISDLTDMASISIAALGLNDVPQELLTRLTLSLFCAHDESDSFQDVWPCEKVRFFNADANHGTLPFSPETQIIELDESIFISPTGTLLNVEGILPGASAFCGLSMSVDNEEIGHDAISFLVAPVLVLSNTNTCLSAFVGDRSGAFATNVEEILQGVCNVEILDDILFPQDCAELAQSTVPLSGHPFQTTVLEFLQSELSTFIGESIGLLHVTNSLANDGGNVETTPPIVGFPFGRLLLGENCGFGTIHFLTNQLLQSGNNGPIFLPLSWLAVGHVDEVVSFIPSNDGFHCLVADFGLATNLLINSTNQWDRHFPVSVSGAISAITNSANGDAVECVVTNLMEIRSRIAASLQIDSSRIVSVPVLFSPPNEVEGHQEYMSHAMVPNMVNLLAVVSPTGTRRLIIPDPAFKPYRDYMTALLIELGYSSDEFVFVETDELHPRLGEAHCGSNVQRIRNP